MRRRRRAGSCPGEQTSGQRRPRKTSSLTRVAVWALRLRRGVAFGLLGGPLLATCWLDPIYRTHWGLVLLDGTRRMYGTADGPIMALRRTARIGSSTHCCWATPVGTTLSPGLLMVFGRSQDRPVDIHWIQLLLLLGIQGASAISMR